MRPVLGLLLAGLVGCAGGGRDRLRDLDRPADDTSARRTASRDGASSGRLEVSPTGRSNKVNAEQLLVATVYDRDGTPRGRRRVEWTLDGPGRIARTDEGGFLPNRGKKYDDKYAVVYTNTFGHSVSRQGGDDVEVKAGQTWCVVTSAVEGQTTVTAYAPDVAAGDGNRVVARLTWTGGRFKKDASEDVEPEATPRAPAATASRPKPTAEGVQVSLDVKVPKAVGVGREVPVAISLANVGTAASQPLTVRATIPDHAEFVRSDPAALRREGQTFTWAFEGLPSSQTQDITLVVRPTKKAALNVRAVAETADGLRAEQEANGDADTAGMKVKVDAPSYAGPDEKATVSVTVTNTGNVPVGNAVAWVDLPDAKGGPIEKVVGTVPAKGSKTVAVPVTFAKAGKATVRVNVTADGGLAERGEAAVTVGRAALDVTITGPATIPVRQDGLFEVRVTNRGDAAVANVKVDATLPRALTAATPTDWTLGTLAAGESKVVRLTATADKPADKLTVSASAAGESPTGGRVAAKESTAAVAVVGLSVLTLDVADPVGPVRVGGTATYRVTVRNRGSSSAHDVVLTADASDELKPTRGTGPNRSAATAAASKLSFPAIAELPAGSTATFTLELEATTAGSARLKAELTSRELTTPVKDEQATQIVK